MHNFCSGARLRKQTHYKTKESFFFFFSSFTFGCIKTNGNSADNSPPSAPRNNLTLIAYETIIPNASRCSGAANL